MEEKSKDINSATDSLSSFIRQFGTDDVYNKIIAEELLRFLMETKKENHASTTN